VFPAIVAGLGAGSPLISVSNQIAGATNVVMQVSLTPDVALPQTKSFVITLSGSGLSCSGGCPVAFRSPTSAGLVAAAAISGAQVLTVTLSTTYSFPYGESISFQISNVTNPSASQAELRNIRAVVADVTGKVAAASNAGTLFPYFKSNLQNVSVVLSNSAVGVGSSGILAHWDFSIFSVQSAPKDPVPVVCLIRFSPSSLSPIRSISITGIAFSNFVVSPSVCNCSYDNVVVPVSVEFSDTSQIIVLNLSEDINVTSSALIISCSFGHFFNSKTRRSGNSATISTFTPFNNPIDFMHRVPYTDLFEGYLSSVSLSLSSVLILEPAALSISFYPASLQHPMRSILVSGIEFAQFVKSSTVCYAQSKAIIANTTYFNSSLSLLIEFSQGINTVSYGLFQCQVVGGSNPNTAMNIRDAVITTYDEGSFPVDIGTSKLPAIFAHKAISLEISLSSYSERTNSTVTVKFVAPQASASNGISFINLTSNIFAGVSCGVVQCSNLEHTGLSMFAAADRIVVLFNGSTSILNAAALVECQIHGVLTAPYSGSNQELMTFGISDSSRFPLLFFSATTFGTICKAGFFAANGACLPCAAGTFCSSNCSTASPCIACPAGFYSVASSSSCLPCHAGSYAAISGKSSCDLCPAGSTSSVAGVNCLHANAFFTAASWSSSTPDVLVDLSPYGNNVINISGDNITRLSPSGEPPYLRGSSNTKLQLPSTMISGNFTLVYVARFEGSSQRNIFHSCSDSTWVSAFHQGAAGVSVRPSCGIITENPASPASAAGNNWVVVTEQALSVRINGQLRSKSNVSDCLLLEDSLCINFNQDHSSDFAIQTFMWFNETLLTDQIVALEALLMTQRKFWTPNSMQVAFLTFYLFLICFATHSMVSHTI
jgi:hypothetical protein